MCSQGSIPPHECTCIDRVHLFHLERTLLTLDQDQKDKREKLENQGRMLKYHQPLVRSSRAARETRDRRVM